jgi:predicted esterase
VPYNPVAGAAAWFSPGHPPAPPAGRSTNPASNTGYASNYSDWDEGEDNDGPSQSLQYVDGLVEEEVRRDASPERIVVGGFGQGCDLALFVEPADGAVAVLSGGLPVGGD